MIKINRNVVAASAVCLCLGFLSCSILVNFYKDMSMKYTNSINELTALLESVQNENKRLNSELNEKNSRITEYENAVSKDSAAIKLISDELDSSRIIAGLTDVSGSGIEVTLNDSDSEATGVDSAALVIHDEDLLNFVNELNSAGAEAVSINDQRIISKSSIRCAGSIVNINGVRVSAPFVIKAIGDPDVLESALNFKGGVVDSLKPWGISVEIEKKDEVYINGYDGDTTFYYAESEQASNGE